MSIGLILLIVFVFAPVVSFLVFFIGVCVYTMIEMYVSDELDKCKYHAEETNRL